MMVLRTLAFLSCSGSWAWSRAGHAADGKEVEIAVLRDQLAVLRRQVARLPTHQATGWCGPRCGAEAPGSVEGLPGILPITTPGHDLPTSVLRGKTWSATRCVLPAPRPDWATPAQLFGCLGHSRPKRRRGIPP